MSKNILVISSSLRKGSNSEALCDEFVNGAKAGGNNVEKITLADKTLGFCKGCLACQNTLKCVINDDAVEIAEKMKQSDVIVFATPVYYYGISGQLKTLLDRANPLYSSDYKFREIYLLATATENEPTTTEGTIKGIQGWVDCFEKAELKDTIFAGGVTEPNEIKNHPALKTAYDTGFAIG